MKRSLKLHRPVQASWSTYLPTSPLFSVLWAFKNSETGKTWTPSVASPPHENMETTNDSQDSSDASKVHTEHRFFSFFSSLLLLEK